MKRVLSYKDVYFSFIVNKVTHKTRDVSLTQEKKQNVRFVSKML